MWPEAQDDIAAQVRQRKAAILEVRDDQIAEQHRLEGACQDELAGRTAFDHANDDGDTAGTVRALHLIDAAVSVKTRCHRLIDEYAEAIGRLQDEITALVPEQRPSDD